MVTQLRCRGGISGGGRGWRGPCLGAEKGDGWFTMPWIKREQSVSRTMPRVLRIPELFSRNWKYFTMRWRHGMTYGRVRRMAEELISHYRRYIFSRPISPAVCFRAIARSAFRSSSRARRETILFIISPWGEKERLFIDILEIFPVFCNNNIRTET